MRILIIVFLITGLLSSASGQRLQAGVTLQLSFPQGEYKSTYPKTGVGVRANALYRIKEESPFSIGGEIGYLVIGSDSKVFDLNYGGYDQYKVSASNNVLSLAFKARADLLPKERPVLIFIESTIGANLFFSSVNVERQTFFGSSQYSDGTTTKGYWAFIWGPGVGVEIPLDKRREAAVVVKGSYLFGANSKYLTDPYIDNNGNVYFNQQESKTNMILAEVGVRLAFLKRR